MEKVLSWFTQVRFDVACLNFMRTKETRKQRIRRIRPEVSKEMTSPILRRLMITDELSKEFPREWMW